MGNKVNKSRKKRGWRKINAKRMQQKIKSEVFETIFTEDESFLMETESASASASMRKNILRGVVQTIDNPDTTSHSHTALMGRNKAPDDSVADEHTPAPDDSVADEHTPAPDDAVAGDHTVAQVPVAASPASCEAARAAEPADGAGAVQPPAAPPPGRLRRRAPPPASTAPQHDKNLRARAGAMGEQQRLAALVRAHPVLYHPEHANRGQHEHTRYAWFDVARSMQRPESECISMWKRLKQLYRSALTRRKRALEQGLTLKPSKYENYLSFMKPFLYIWTKVTAADESGSGDEAAPSAPERSRARPSRPRNTLVELFRNLGETVRTFPKDMRSRVKSEVLKVVSDARDLVSSNNSVEQLYIVENVKEETMDLQQS